MIDYLNESDLSHLNERTIKAHGGIFEPPENIADREALTALLEEITSETFPKIGDKAAAYLHGIITRDLFLDANARTGLLAARTFVWLNDGAFHRKLKVVDYEGSRVPAEGKGTNNILYHLVREVAAGAISLPACQEWFRRNIS